jgi:hypothetical protein
VAVAVGIGVGMNVAVGVSVGSVATVEEISSVGLIGSESGLFVAQALIVNKAINTIQEYFVFFIMIFS